MLSFFRPDVLIPAFLPASHNGSAPDFGSGCRSSILWAGANMQTMETDGIVVVSCFDGMACAYTALKESGIKVKKYG
jgi:hypothetical protein